LRYRRATRRGDTQTIDVNLLLAITSENRF